METPPGGCRGSIALDVVFLLLEPPVMDALVVDPDTDDFWEPELVIDAVWLWLWLSLLSLFPDVFAEAEAELDCDADADEDEDEDAWVGVGCTVHHVSLRRLLSCQATNLNLSLA